LRGLFITARAFFQEPLTVEATALRRSQYTAGPLRLVAESSVVSA
jgi:hypothetical protein